MAALPVVRPRQPDSPRALGMDVPLARLAAVVAVHPALAPLAFTRAHLLALRGLIASLDEGILSLCRPISLLYRESL
jgi:hypothetical protein